MVEILCKSYITEYQLNDLNIVALKDIPQMVKTIEECWDIDVEARLSSECAANRLRKLTHIKFIDT